MKILIVDNYDSFTFNLLHYLQALNEDVSVIRNDKIVLEEINPYDAIVLSPGPGLPQEAGKSIEIINAFYQTKKILGVCLGHQTVALAFGGRLKNLKKVLHGVSRTTYICRPADAIYKNMPDKIICGRYHSWVVDKSFLPSDLEITAYDEDNEIMSLKHKMYDVRGVQFHPESIMTEYGMKILENWLRDE